MGAEQTRRRACGWVEFVGLSFFQKFFKLWQFAILQLSHFVEIAFASQFFNLLAQLVDLLAHVLTALSLRFFSLPNFFQIGCLFFQADDFFFNQAQTFLRSFIGFFFHCLAFNLELNQTSVELVDHLWLGVNFNLDFGSCLVNQINGFVG